MPTLRIPLSVYHDTLDPLTSGMAEEIGLPKPSFVKRGKGGTMIYNNVTVDQAREVADYIWGRGDMLLGEGGGNYDDADQRERNTYRAAMKCAERIWADVGKPAPVPRPPKPSTGLKYGDLHVGMRLRVKYNNTFMTTIEVGDEATVVRLAEGKPPWGGSAVLQFEDRASGGWGEKSADWGQFEIVDASVKVLSVEDHGVFRGRRTWTVRIEDQDGRAQVSAIDVEKEFEAVAQALDTRRNQRTFTPEEREALRRSNEALREGLS